MTLLLLIGLLDLISKPLYAQQPPAPQDARYSFAFIHVPMGQALEQFIHRTNIDMLYASDLVEGKTAYCNIENATIKEVLSCILKEADLDFYQQSSGVFVITLRQEEAPRFGSLSGIVLDANTNEPLAYASIFLEEAETGAASNIEGRFAFSRLRPGMHRIYTSHVAYQAKTDSLYINPESNQQLSIYLSPRTVMSTPIVVDGLHQRLPSEELNAFSISASELQNAPGASTPSTLQALDAVVGVHVGDALSDVHLQGGDSGEHQYMLDSAPVFVPIRNGGFFGSFSPFAINQITVHKAGFEASQGSYLSGSVQMNHDLLSSDGSTATFQIDPLSVNGRLNGHLGKDKNLSAQWMAAGRLGIWDILKPPQIEDSFREWSRPNAFLSQTLNQSEEPLPDFSDSIADSLLRLAFNDIHAAARIRYGSTRSLYASFYNGRNLFGLGTVPFILPDDEDDETDDLPAENYRWFNQTLQFRYEWLQGNRTFLSLGFWRSKYRLIHPFADSPFLSLSPDVATLDNDLSEDFNEIEEFSIYTRFDWSPSSKHVISGNLEYVDTIAQFKLSIDPFADSLAITNATMQPLSLRLQSFVEDAISLSQYTRLVLGSRFTYIPIQRRLYAEPRFSLRHDFRDQSHGIWAAQFAGGLYRQFYNQFDVASYNNTALLPSFRFWIPINADTRASTAYHLAGSLLFIPNSHWQFNFETYYKYNPYLTVLDYTARLDATKNATDPNIFLKQATGYAYGTGFSGSYHGAGFNLTGTYEYAISRRKLENRFANRYVPVPWETPHQIFIIADFTPANHLTLTLRWQGLYGRSWGYRRAYYDYIEPDASLTGSVGINLSEPQEHKLPAYSQWDLGIAYSKKAGRIGIQGRFNVINLFNESNTIDWVLVRDDNGSIQRLSRKTTSLFPTASLKITY